MSWLNVLAPLIAVILAYFGGYIAGKKATQLKQIKKERGESEDVQQIIDSNNMLDLHRADMWLQERSKK